MKKFTFFVTYHGRFVATVEGCHEYDYHFGGSVKPIRGDWEWGVSSPKVDALALAVLLEDGVNQRDAEAVHQRLAAMLFQKLEKNPGAITHVSSGYLHRMTAYLLDQTAVDESMLPANLVKMQKLSPGAYTDGKGTLHFYAREFCEEHGYEPSKENMRLAESEFVRLTQEKNPDMRVHFVEDTGGTIDFSNN